MNTEGNVIKRNQYLSLLLLLPIASAFIGECLAILSSYSNSSYAIEPLQQVMVLSEIAAALLIVMFIAGFYCTGRPAMYVLDALRIAAVVLLCVCLYLVLSQRATLMGYVWFSDLESGNIQSVKALNFGVASAAVYAVSILLCAATGVIEVVASKKARSREGIQAQIAALQKQLESLG